MKKLNFGIVGCGRIANRHAIHINSLGNLTAVCDIDINKANKFGDQYNCNIYDDIDKLLNNEKDIDVISICTPNGLHSDHAIKSLNKGFHVLVEKPMALNVHDCGEMIKTAERANKRLFIVKQNRFNPPVIKVKDLLDNKKLGKVFSFQLNCFWNRNDNYYNKSYWKGTNDLDGGILYTQFSHFIDLLYFFFGEVIKSYSFSNNYNHNETIDFDDTIVSILYFYSGIIGTINCTINSYDKNMEGSLTIFGEKGTVKIGGQYLNELEYQNIKGIDKIVVDKGNPPNNYGEYVGSMSNHYDVYKNVIETINGKGVIMTNCYDGLMTVQIIDKIYNSNERLHL